MRRPNQLTDLSLLPLVQSRPNVRWSDEMGRLQQQEEQMIDALLSLVVLGLLVTACVLVWVWS